MPRVPAARGAPARGSPPALDWLDEGVVERVREALRRRTCYRDEPGPIALIQTHISSVLLTTRHVFKFKRPVDVGFADFRRLAARRRDCVAELRLNRRLAEGVYLDVLPLWEAGEGFSLEGGERIVDYCVVMERLAAGEMLDSRVREGRVPPGAMEALARLLVDFHRRPGRRRGIARFGGLEVVRENWEENFRQTEPWVGKVLSPARFASLRAAVDDFLARHEALFRDRVAGGRIRDGHGDLRCEHVHLGERIRIIDCIEFNDRFRFGDLASDLAFLLMDLTALGRPDLSRALLAHYVALSGDADLERLVPFYACYRAYVRGKVTSMKLADRNLAPPVRAALRNRAAGFFRLAEDFAHQMRPPVLVLVAGRMGTGKSALAQALARRTGMEHFNSDALRKELAQAAGQPGREAGFGAGIYTPAWNERTYRALAERGERALRAGRSVILDASFSRRADRDTARALAARRGARVVLVECRLGERETLARLRGRTRAGGSVSDGREALYPRQRAAFEPITELPAEEHLEVVTDRSPEALAGWVAQRLELPPAPFAAAG